MLEMGLFGEIWMNRTVGGWGDALDTIIGL